MDRRIAKLPPQDRSRFSSWILKFSDVFDDGGVTFLLLLLLGVIEVLSLMFCVKSK